MSDTAFHPADRLDALLATLLDKSLSDAEWSELRATLAKEPASIDRYLDFVTLHALLEVEVGWQRAIQNHEVDIFADADPMLGAAPSLSDAMILPAIREVAPDERISDPPVTPKAERFEKEDTPIGKMNFRRGWFLAACLLLAATIAIAIMHTAPAPRAQASNLATLTQTLEARWDASSGQMNPGDALPVEKQLSLASGWAELTYANGVVVTVEGPARFSVKRDQVLSLDAGKLTAEVPPAGHGFTVRTVSATVVDLGTEFGVATYADGKSDVQVFRGHVTVAAALSADHPSATAEPVEVTEGNAREVGTNGAVVAIQLPDSTFVRPQKLEAWVKADNATPYERWRAFSERLRRDPTLIAYYTFENRDVAPNRLVNYSIAGAALDGVLGGGDPASVPMWTTGRWPLKGALEFHSGEDQHVLIPNSPALNFSRAGQTAAPFSIAIWVKGVGDYDSALVTRGRAAAEQYAVGAQPQKFRVWVRDQLTAERSGTAFDLSGGSDGEDEWHGVVATYDPVNLQLILYVDGTQCAAMKAPAKLLDAPGQTRIGAREGLPGDSPVNLEGSVDEVAIFNRVLPADEVRAMYVAGKPD